MSLRLFIVSLIATWLGAHVALAQPISLTLSSTAATPNSVVSLNLSLQSTGGVRPASLQWELEYSASAFASIEVVAGPAAVVAKKQVICNIGQGNAKCAAVGLVDGQLNKNDIGNGIVARVRLHVSPNPQGSDLAVRVVRALAASSNGHEIAVSGATGQISVSGVQAGLSQLRCEPSWISAPGTTACTIGLSGPAPAGGLQVTLTSNSALLSFPDVVTVPGGGAERSFAVEAGAANRRQTVTVTAQVEGGQRSFDLTVGPPVGLTSMVCEPTQAKPATSPTCTIRLSEPAFPGGAAIAVSSSSGSLLAPGLVNARAGQSSLRFRADVSSFAKSQSVSLSASLGISVVRENITVAAGVLPVLMLPGQQTVIHGEELQFQVSAHDPGGLPVTMSATMLPAGALLTPNGTFRWTPQLSHRGTHTIRFWASNSVGAAASEDLSIRVVDRKPIITGLVESAGLSAQAPCSRAGLATLFGTGITTSPPQSAPTMPLPSILADVRVKINGTPAPLLFVSSTQVNFQCPDLVSGTQLRVTAESALGVSPPAQAILQFAGPGIFTLDSSGGGQGAIIVANRQTWAMIRNAVLPSEPALPGDYISIFATGLGPVSEAIVVGHPAPLDPLATVESYVEVWIGGQLAELQFAGLAPGFVGSYQVNAKVPAGLSTDDQTPVTLRLHAPDGTLLESNEVTMAVERQ